MKVIALEEHFATAEVIAAWEELDPELQDIAVGQSTENGKQRRLLDLAEARIAAMDEAGIDVQVLSLTTPGVQSLAPDRAVALARRANDLMSATVRRHPDRFQGFATLPTSAPEETVRELKRAVCELGLYGSDAVRSHGGSKPSIIRISHRSLMRLPSCGRRSTCIPNHGPTFDHHRSGHIFRQPGKRIH